MIKTSEDHILRFNAGLGHRVRLLRQSRKMSQKALAEALGVTFQQVQKYENGSNRITVDRLVEVARIFNVGMEYFLDDNTQAHAVPAGLNKIVLCLAGEVMKIPDMDIQKSLYHLIRTIGKAMNENDEDSNAKPKSFSRYT